MPLPDDSDQGPRPARDPRAKKARDLARQRKIASNSSDKAARRNAPKIKAMANRAARRSARADLDAETDESADCARLHHRAKPAHWGSVNAAAHRAGRAGDGGA